MARIAEQNAGERIPSLDRILVFKDLSAEMRERVQKRCTMRQYQPGEPIVSHLDNSLDVFFIVAGGARVNLYSMQGKSVGFCDLGPGEMFGEVAAIDGGPRSASVEAFTASWIASMSAGAFRDLLASESSVAQALVLYLARKVRQLTVRVYEFSAMPVSTRIQAELLRIAELAPRDGRSASIAPMPTHAEIASRTSTHREAATREISRLTRMGLLEKRGRCLVITDVARLASMVKETVGE